MSKIGEVMEGGEEEVARGMEALRALYKYEGTTLGEMLDAEYGVQNTRFVKDRNVFSGRNEAVESVVQGALVYYCLLILEQS